MGQAPQLCPTDQAVTGCGRRRPAGWTPQLAQARRPGDRGATGVIYDLRLHVVHPV